jgi:hypothetical protein
MTGKPGMTMKKESGCLKHESKIQKTPSRLRERGLPADCAALSRSRAGPSALRPRRRCAFAFPRRTLGLAASAALRPPHGHKPEARFNFIQENAEFAEGLDI